MENSREGQEVTALNLAMVSQSLGRYYNEGSRRDKSNNSIVAIIPQYATWNYDGEQGQE
jgi:hypothetical protein